MTSKLASFADIIRQGKEKKLADDAEELNRKKKEATPFLSELFSTVVKSKQIVEKRQGVYDKVDELVQNQITQDDINELVTEKLELTESEANKKLTSVVKKLQDDMANLKRYVDSTNSRMVASSWGTAGSGEVRILRMDDIDLSNLQDGNVMTYSSSLNKIVFNTPTSGTDEEMPYAKRVDFITDNELYKGEAPVGSLESDPVWRVHKVIIGADSDVTETWASGNALYNKRWSDRLTYTYS